ncbi:hypothetical protein [Desulfobulbus alkaliphilus]|uniref:hypothetical protein n=1 Tax=Desulfobulbus alkaliphilus TaxID=869814 RepID=UPI001962F8D5|nr:hypothetical protein [Desulfobulbus alkaliphilus]MBM9538346.1 hypothetical protein [Desulfobulbus alkaliphilus]
MKQMTNFESPNPAHRNSLQPLRVHLHTTQLFGPSDPFLLKVLDAAVWYAAKSTHRIDFDIFFHPTRNPLNIVGFALSLKSKILSIAKINLYSLGGLLSLNLSKKIDPKQKEFRENSNNSDIIEGCFKISGLAIRLKRFQHPLYHSLRAWAFSHRKGLQLFISCFGARGFEGKKLLKLNYAEICIGDLVASSTFRLRPYGGGSLSRSKLAVLEQLIDAVAIIEYIKKNVPQFTSVKDQIKHLVLVREPTYLDAIYTRKLAKLDLDVVEWYPYDAIYRKTQGQHYRPFEERMVKLTGQSGSAGSIAKAQQYLRERTEDPSLQLSYLKKAANISKVLEDENGVVIEADGPRVNVGIFLHSFNDAQYVYGPDGFSDLYEWAVFTVETLLSNPVVDKVIIKPHPNVDYRNYPGDKIAIQKLRQAYPTSSKLKWASVNSSPVAFNRSGQMIGVTHHGSMAEELVFLKVPVIASIYAPWSRNYQFLKTWVSPSEYKELLLGDLRAFRVSDEELDNLFAYVTEARLKTAITMEERYPWYSYLKMKSMDTKGSFFEVMSLARKELDENGLDENLLQFLELQHQKYCAND